MKNRPVILVSNDDGVRAEGLVALVKSLKKIGRVVVVAPDQQRSATSHSITLHRPLRVHKIDKDIYSIDGTPTDCIVLGLHKLMRTKPDLIISGINHGPNLGDDVHYSGTVSAAIEGSIKGVPSIAISLVTANGHSNFAPAAKFAARLAKKVLEKPLPPGVILNVNVPDVSPGKIKGYMFTTQGKRSYSDIIIEKVDPRGRKYYWIGGGDANYSDIPQSDCNAIFSGRISITPLRVNMTDHEVLGELIGWKL